MEKTIWRSRTIWTKFMLVAVALSYRPAYEWIQKTPEAYLLIDAALTFILRTLTKGPVRVRRATHPMILVALPLLLFSSCSNLGVVQPDRDISPSKFYRRDMIVKVDGAEFPGYGVLPLKNSYRFEVETRHDMDRFLATTCHRQIVSEKVGSGGGWFSKTTKYKFDFARQGSVEQTDPCALELIASAESNDHSFAFFDFVTPDYKLQAKVECDGWQGTYPGVSVCQSKKGLIQKITFEERVRVSPDVGCEIPTKTGTQFMFEIPRGRCALVFCTKDDRCHRLTTLGYDEAWKREASR